MQNILHIRYIDITMMTRFDQQGSLVSEQDKP